MKKEEAEKRLASIETEVKELRKIIKEASHDRPITERVKTFEDALEIVGASDNVKILLNYNGIDKDMISHQAHAKLTIIARALNEGWTPDWENPSQYKWYPWFKIKSGFAFSSTDYEYANSDTAVGSRLCFSGEKLAEYAGKQFENIYKDFLI